MTDAVLRSTQGRIGILTVNNPPVNALAAGVRDGIKDGVEAFGKDANIDAIVLIGGGLETALGAHYRVSLASTRVGLPEVHLGLLPGAGGTQRLPRLTGAKYALDAIISGRHIPAPEAKTKGIIDAIVEGDLLASAVAHAQMLVAQKAPLRRVRDLKVTLESPDLFKETERAIARRARGFKAPWSISRCVQAACELPFDEGRKRDRGLKTIRTNYENTAKRGGMKAEHVTARMALITPTLSYDGLKDADVVIEAVFETMEVKEGVFTQLDAVAKPGAVLAT